MLTVFILKSPAIWEDVTTVIDFFLSNERLKFEAIFRNNFALEFWRPLTIALIFELDFVNHISKVPSCPFPRAKDPNFYRDLQQQHL